MFQLGIIVMKRSRNLPTALIHDRSVMLHSITQHYHGCLPWFGQRDTSRPQATARRFSGHRNSPGVSQRIDHDRIAAQVGERTAIVSSDTVFRRAPINGGRASYREPPQGLVARCTSMVSMCPYDQCMYRCTCRPHVLDRALTHITRSISSVASYLHLLGTGPIAAGVG
jgi:hypothetical protein